MATTLVTPLPPVALSLNRTVATFETDTIYATLGSSAVNVFQIVGTIFNNRQITISYGSVSQTFITAALLPPNGTNLLSGLATLDLAEDLVPYFQANYYLNRDFTITHDLVEGIPVVIFTAKQVGSAYNFVPVVYTAVTVGNTVAGTDKLKKKNLCLQLQVQVKRSDADTYDTVYAEKIPYRSSRISLNVSRLLHAELSPDFPAAWDTTVPWLHTRSLRKYRLVTAEGFGDPLSFQPQETFPDAIVQYGGTGFKTGLSKTAAQWVQGATADLDKFLRLGPALRWVQTDEPVWLSFLNTRDAIEELNIQIRIEYVDDSIVTVTRDLGELEQYQAITIPVWATALELEAEDPEKAIRSYYVRLQSGEENISEELRYVIDYANREQKQYFVFLNSVGGWDSLLCYGDGSYSFNLSNQQIFHPIPSSYQTYQGDLSDVGAVMRDKFVVSTSFYSLEGLKVRFRDFFSSEYKYRYIDGKCYPISITSKDFPEGADGQNQYKHDFEYQFGFENPVFD
ncbi:hypothetical protein [Runella zeae]|uniref:hypothetical protein n=1 Tax=Runella zeae TaxID=94255 RepID=UPI0023571D3A|nr:hypothetical protein [Runella zeae]